MEEHLFCNYSIYDSEISEPDSVWNTYNFNIYLEFR